MVINNKKTKEGTRCPYCHDTISSESVKCASCNAAHHISCMMETTPLKPDGRVKELEQRIEELEDMINIKVEDSYETLMHCRRMERNQEFRCTIGFMIGCCAGAALSLICYGWACNGVLP